MLVERTATGGQAGQSSRIENYLGFPDGVSGAQLTERARRQAIKFGAELITTRDVVGLDVNGPARTVRFADGGSIDAHTVILATGVSYRHLAAEGVDQLSGRGVFYGSALTEAANCKEQDVYIVGGANSAGQAAVYLSAGRAVGDDPGARRRAHRVDVVLPHRADPRHREHHACAPAPRSSRRTARSSSSSSRCGTRTPARPRRSTPAGCSCSSAPRRAPTGWTAWCSATRTASCWPARTSSPTARCRAGWIPERQPFHLETSVPGVFVAGDVRAESAKRVASAVGEGAMAVMLVHRYLEGL